MSILGFEAGTHVIIEREDEPVIAGHLLAEDEDGGILMSVTHKMMPVEVELTQGHYDDIREGLGSMSMKRMRFLGVVNGIRGALRMGEEKLIEKTVEKIAEQYMESRGESYELQPLEAPIRTYIGGWTVKLAEATEDRNANALINNFKAELDKPM